MKWDYENNLPVEGTYQHREYDKDALKSYIEESFPYPEFPEIHSALKSVNWNLEEFFLKKANKEIHGEEFYISLLLYRKDELSDYWVDLANGHWDLSLPIIMMWDWVPKVIIDETDIYRRLFFCESYTDIWDLAIDLPLARNVTCNLLECYMGKRKENSEPPEYLKDPDKAQMMIKYIKAQKKGKDVLIKKGSVLETAAQYGHQGQIIELTSDSISVRLSSLLTLELGYRIPERYKDKIEYAIEVDYKYYATKWGYEAAMSILQQLSEDEEILLEQPQKIDKVIKEYRERVNDKTSILGRTKALIEIQEKYFPNIEDMVFDENIIDKFNDYLTKVESFKLFDMF